MYIDGCTLIAAGIILAVSVLFIINSDKLAPTQARNLFRHRSRRPYRPHDE